MRGTVHWVNISSSLSGVPPAGASVLCSLFGSTTPFRPSQMAQLYGNKATYLARYEKSLNRAISGRYILPQDRVGIVAQARASPISVVIPEGLLDGRSSGGPAGRGGKVLRGRS